MGDDGMIATFCLLEHTLRCSSTPRRCRWPLTHVLSAVMGKKTVDPSDFFGPGCTDIKILRSFSSDRLRRHAVEPVNSSPLDDACDNRDCTYERSMPGFRLKRRRYGKRIRCC